MLGRKGVFCSDKVTNIANEVGKKDKSNEVWINRRNARLFKNAIDHEKAVTKRKKNNVLS